MVNDAAQLDVVKTQRMNRINAKLQGADRQMNENLPMFLQNKANNGPSNIEYPGA